VRSLAVGIRRDLPAVINGLTLEHSSGAVEGTQVTGPASRPAERCSGNSLTC
jgi:hypothetical protein